MLSLAPRPYPFQVSFSRFESTVWPDFFHHFHSASLQIWHQVNFQLLIFKLFQQIHSFYQYPANFLFQMLINAASLFLLAQAQGK
jgi:hypothetical protein